MITYPSTHGVYEDGVDEICRIIHDNGGQVRASVSWWKGWVPGAGTRLKLNCFI